MMESRHATYAGKDKHSESDVPQRLYIEGSSFAMDNTLLNTSIADLRTRQHYLFAGTVAG